MSWSSWGRVVAVLAVTFVLAACSTVRPLYGDTAAVGSRAFAYAAPASRLDQIIYAELRVKLGPSSGSADAIRVAVSASSSARAVTRTNVSKPASTSEMIVTASVSAVGADGVIIFAGSRSASALYTTSGQVLADTAAQTEAAERAARALADTIRLAILGALEAGPAR